MTVRVSLPVLSDPAETLNATLPAVSTFAPEATPPPLSVTVPVGVGWRAPPPTVTTTERDCAEVMLEAEGATVIVGVALAAAVTATETEPVAPL